MRYLVMILIMLVPSLVLAEPAENASKYIDGLGKKYLNVLTDPNQNYAKRSATFRSILKNDFDFQGIARSALGQYWNEASEAEKKEYLKAFEDYITKIYTIRFAEYPKTKFDVTNARVDEDRVIVTTMVKSDKTPEPVRIDWRLVQSGNGFKIQDVMIEGISMIISQRSEFNSVIQQNGNSVSGLVKILKEKTATSAPAKK